MHLRCRHLEEIASIVARIKHVYKATPAQRTQCTERNFDPLWRQRPQSTLLQFTSLISNSFSIIIVDIIVCHCSHTCRNGCKEFPHGTCMVHHRAIYCACVFGRTRVVDASSSSVRNVQKRRGKKSEKNQAHQQKKKRKIEIGTLIKKAEIR